MSEDSVTKAAVALRDADAIFVTAGAGMGVDSGLPDFRGREGFWKAYPPFAKLGKSFVEMANPDWFYLNPRLAWAFYGHRLNLYRNTNPHSGFMQMLEIARIKSGGYFVFTSNVDGQFQKAGYDVDRIEECHGSVHYLQCSTPCSEDIWDASEITLEIDENAFEAVEPLPRCASCGAVARPNVLMFGDWAWNTNRARLQSQRFAEWLRSVRDREMRLAIIEIGAGKAIATVRAMSEYVARAYDARLIRINPRDHDVSTGHISIPLGAAKALGRICEAVRRN